MRAFAPLALRVTPAPAPRTQRRPLRCALPPALRRVAPRLRRTARVLPPRALSAAGRTAAVTGAYISVAGAALLAAPLRTLGLLFSCDGLTPAWVRVFGVLCLTFGCYYGGTAALEARGAPCVPSLWLSRLVCSFLLLLLLLILSIQAPHGVLRKHRVWTPRACSGVLGARFRGLVSGTRPAAGKHPTACTPCGFG